MTADGLDTRHRLAARVLLRWPRQLNDLIEDTSSWVALLGVAALSLLGIGVAWLVAHVLDRPEENAVLVGVACGLAVGCLIAGWMMLGLAIGWHLRRLGGSSVVSPRIIRARRMLVAADTTLPADPRARRAR